MEDRDRAEPGVHRPLAYRRRTTPALAAVYAGLVGGTLLLVLAFIGWGVTGQSIGTPLRLVAATFFPRWGALSNLDAGPIIAGLVLHYGVSICWALLFASLVEQSKPATAFAWGLVFGVGVGVLMRFTVLTVMAPSQFAAVAPWPFIIAHALYGISLGSYRLFAKALDRRRVSPEAFVPAHSALRA